MSSSITINGKIIKVQGEDLSIIGGKIYVDGKLVEENKALQTAVKIELSGEIMNLATDKSVNVEGRVGGHVSAGGSVNCGCVRGDVKAGGSVNCHEVYQNVNAGGSVKCYGVEGNVTASGSVKIG